MFVAEHDGAAPGNDGARVGDPGGKSRRGPAMAASDKELSASAKGRDRGSPPPRSLGHVVAASYLHNETTPPRFPACRHMRMCPATGRTITRQHNVTVCSDYRHIRMCPCSRAIDTASSSLALIILASRFLLYVSVITVCSFACGSCACVRVLSC